MASRKALTAAVVALLNALPDDQLGDVLGALNAKGVVKVEQPKDRPQRPCGVCGLSYPRCRARWSEDHDYEAPK